MNDLEELERERGNSEYMDAKAAAGSLGSLINYGAADRQQWDVHVSCDEYFVEIEQNEIGMKGDFTVPLTEPVVLNEERKKVLDTIVEQINMVLYTIIPGMKIDVYHYGMQLTDSGENGYRVELVSIRENMPPIPIRMESEGIIKIISILNALI